MIEYDPEGGGFPPWFEAKLTVAAEGAAPDIEVLSVSGISKERARTVMENVIRHGASKGLEERLRAPGVSIAIVTITAIRGDHLEGSIVIVEQD